MFTGIIQSLGKILSIESMGRDARMHFYAAEIDLSTVSVGDSIAVDGVCLTVSALDNKGFYADVSAETLACTTFAQRSVGDMVNLEESLTPTTHLGGHFVSGHVDGVGEVVSSDEDGRSVRLSLKAPKLLCRYIASKGSICIDGVSLTVNRVDGDRFDINVIPHTLEKTTLSRYRQGTQVNLEVDLIARYLERLLLEGGATKPTGSEISRAFLARHGYLNSD